MVGGGGGGRKVGVWNWSLQIGDFPEISPPLNETLLCGLPVFVLFCFVVGWLRWLLPGYT